MKTEIDKFIEKVNDIRKQTGADRETIVFTLQLTKYLKSLPRDQLNAVYEISRRLLKK